MIYQLISGVEPRNGKLAPESVFLQRYSVILVEKKTCAIFQKKKGICLEKNYKISEREI